MNAYALSAGCLQTPSGLPFFLGATSSFLLEPDISDVLSFGKGHLFLPPGIESSSGIANPSGGETVIFPNSPNDVILLEPSETKIGPGSLLMAPARGSPALLPAKDDPIQGENSMNGDGSHNSSNGKPVTSEAYWALLTQGGPLFLAALGDAARARSSAMALRAAGTFSDSPTQDPNSIFSFPMRLLAPGNKYWGGSLATADKRALDLTSNQYALAYTVGKTVKYAASIVGNAAAMKKIAEDPSLSPDQRDILMRKNYFDCIGNIAFLLEKGAYGLNLGMIGLAQYFGEQSSLWTFGYLGGAFILNTALATATVAWWEKLKSGKVMLAEQRDKYLEKQAEGMVHNIDTANVTVALFNAANAAPRVIKHGVIHTTALALGAAYFLPGIFGHLLETDYFQSATQKLGDGTPAELLYRWSNFSARIPDTLIYIGLAFAVVSPLIGLALSSGKAYRDLMAKKMYRSFLAEANGSVEHIVRLDGGKGLTETEINRRLRKINYQFPINALGVAGALTLLGTGVCVSFPQFEPFALALTSLYGFITFANYNYIHREAVNKFVRSVPDLIADGAQTLMLNLLHPEEAAAKHNVRSATKKLAVAAEGRLWQRIIKSFAQARVIIKEGDRTRKEAVSKLSFGDRCRANLSSFKESLSKWAAFLKANFRQTRSNLKAPSIEELLQENGNGKEG